MTTRFEEALRGLQDYVADVTVSTTSALSEVDVRWAAGALDATSAHVVAVAEVESWSYGAFLPGGHPTCLFERHVFSRRTGGRYDATHPGISSPRPGGYGKVSAQPGRLAEARRLDEVAAVCSASWGMFQIMAFNYEACGYDSPLGFEAAMRRSAREQLKAFVRLLIAQGLDAPLRECRWHDFGRGYNGPKYAAHNYHGRLSDAYRAAGGKEP